MDEAALAASIGRSETGNDIASASAVAGLAALMNHAAPPWRTGELPPLAHWLHFQPHALQSDIDIDGHPKRGGLLPSIDLPRRMWAGSRVQFMTPIAFQTPITRRSTVSAAIKKTGRTGDMVFVTLTHEISAKGALAIREEQDIVYRAAARPGATPPPPAVEKAAPSGAEHVIADSVRLFRFSALTFNGHRIHYDRDYARDVEGYPGLVVHGPYIATLLLDYYLRRHPAAPIQSFEFRAQSPLFDTAPFYLTAQDDEAGAQLSALAPDGAVAMSAVVKVKR